MAGTIRPRKDPDTVERTDMDVLLGSLQPSRQPPIETTGGIHLTEGTAIRGTIGHREDTDIRDRIIITETDTDIHGLSIITGAGGTGDSRDCHLLNSANELSSQKAVR